MLSVLGADAGDHTGDHALPRARRRRAARAGLGAVVAAGVFAAATPQALAYTATQRVEQTRYAKETVNLSYTEFVKRKADFTKAGCRRDGYENNGAAYPGCTKPTPYNAFNWSDDGCSGRDSLGRPISLIYRNLFNQPCQLHDFGYRNFGHGLTLGRNEDTRRWIDDRFLAEMNRLCVSAFAGNRPKRTLCLNEAKSMYSYLRLFGEKWDKPSATPLAPLDPDPAPGGGSVAPATHTEQSGSLGSPTFTNPYNASGAGARVAAMSSVQVTCRVYAPAIASANPDGWWYRIASTPWSNQYYAVANTFWNGDVPGRKPYTHNTDFAVPVC